MTKPTIKKADIATPRRPAGAKLIRPIPCDEGSTDPQADITHLLKEMWRLGLRFSDIESVGESYLVDRVLSNLIAWLGAHPGEAYSELLDWRIIDRKVMDWRLSKNRRAKPRIELTAEITRQGNLSVRWYPRGYFGPDSWSTSGRPIEPAGGDYTGYIDFGIFDPHSKTDLVARPLNELMFIRGVGNLNPDPTRKDWQMSELNWDVLDAILIGAVSAAFNLLVEQLRRSFEVTLRNNFEFDLVKVPSESRSALPIMRQGKNRVVNWRLVNLEVAPFS